MRLKLLFFALLFFSFLPSKAQFDKKITFNAFIGGFEPIGAKVDPDGIPYVFPNFKNGGQIGLGGQYNLNPNFSVGLNLVSSASITYKDPTPLQSGQSLDETKYKSSFSMYSLGADIRYKLFPGKKFNPYVYGELNFNIYKGTVAPHFEYIDQSQPDVDTLPNISNKYTISRFNQREINSSFALGVLGGAGFDLKVSNTFVLFAQTSYNLKFTNNNSIIQKNLNYISAQVGLRFSIFKSKSLL
jgi:hypothetical protein